MSIDAEFRELWLASGRATDVFEFLRTRRGLDPAQWLAVLHTHQQYLWRTDQPLAVEDYLTALSGIPGLPQEVDWRLQLVIGEFEARRQTDRPLSHDELSNRFPDLSETLRERLQAASSIAEELNENEAKPQTPDAPTSFESPATLPIGINSIIGKLQNGHQQQGRYRLDRILGEGAFGCVYLAYDQDLHRQVAVKVPAKGRFQCPEDAEMYLAEARIVASLDHPHIVSVYDMGRADDGSVYVVSRFIEGTTLAAIIEEKSATHRDAAAMLATVAKALHYAHEKRLIHRDIKPANILIDGKSGTPFVADFGLAIREDDYLRQHTLAGTPAYMSPEQARGEGHRLDGRSDIFALGVMLYELLTGKKPFDGTSSEATLDAVISQSPTALRELDGTIAPELERICLKALSKRASDRYATAAAMADDLEAWLQPQPEIVPPKTDRQIVPRGLRSFGPDDADFFLDLLPGPRNRAGLPESIAFWKQRIEQTDPEQTFSVGLLYGPSGCGKSSLVKAGLIPHLSPDVIAIYLEATPEETESRLLRQLRARLPELSVDLGLAETAERIRRTDGCKVVMIVDQFEQWLHAHRVDEAADLIRSFRHCDGSRLQAVLMIRDDFYLAAARLMNHIDVPIVTDQNFKLVDLFDLEHARRVLIRFGAAYNRLPAGTTGQSSALSAEQSTFVSAVVDGLAESGKVVSVRLSLLADMLKGRDWVPATLASIGGLSGIGVSFLEETFASIRSDARHRSHQLAVRGVLRALLPEVGTDIKGSMRSEEALLAASGYADRPHAFQELLRILDSELRLLTPTDADGQATSPQPSHIVGMANNSPANG